MSSAVLLVKPPANRAREIYAQSSGILNSLSAESNHRPAHLLADDVERAEASLAEAQVYQRDIEWLSRCDVLVPEASGSSYGVGFEVGYVIGRAHQTLQRVLLVYDAARRHAVSRLIAGNCDAACSTFEYRTLEELASFIDRELGPSTGPAR